MLYVILKIIQHFYIPFPNRIKSKISKFTSRRNPKTMNEWRQRQRLSKNATLDFHFAPTQQQHTNTHFYGNIWIEFHKQITETQTNSNQMLQILFTNFYHFQSHNRCLQFICPQYFAFNENKFYYCCHHALARYEWFFLYRLKMESIYQ